MIVTNWIAKIIVSIAAKFTPGTLGVTIWPCIFIWPAKYASNKKLVTHEMVHLQQYKRYWIIGFIPLYLYYHRKYGYWNNPLEVEARGCKTMKQILSNIKTKDQSI